MIRVVSKTLGRSLAVALLTCAAMLPLAGCDKVECAQFRGTTGSRTCRGTWTGCADRKPRIVSCRGEGASFSCDCIVGNETRRSFSVHHCSLVDPTRSTTTANAECGWKLSLR